MKKFEYHSKSCKKPAQIQELNPLGEKGWELVQILESKDDVIFVMKREITSCVCLVEPLGETHATIN